MTNPNPATTPTCPKWCDGAHEDPSLHRAILWADELDENPIAVSLFNADEALGYEAAAGAAFVSSVQRTCKVLHAHRRLPMTVTELPAHPAWCDLEHATEEIHRSVLWTDEHFDGKRVAVSLVSSQNVPEVSLKVDDADLWLSYATAATVVHQLTHALAMAATEVAEALENPGGRNPGVARTIDGPPAVSVRDAAVANGWDPSEGSPWVGPDGITYPSKSAFYAAMTAGEQGSDGLGTAEVTR